MLFSSCNLVTWNQKRIDKKLKRNEITSQEFVNANSTIHYYKGGEGPVVLLIHGFGGDAQITWYETMLELCKTHTVIAPDLLWFGKSNSALQPNLESQSSEIIRLLNSLKVDKFSVAGISYGGFVSLDLIYNHTERIEKAVILDSPGMTYDMSLLSELSNKAGTDDFSDIFVPQKPEDVQRLMNLAFYKEPKIPKRILRNTYKLYFDQHHTQLYKLLQSLKSEQDKFLETEITFPECLVMWGEEDEIFPVSEGAKLAEYMNAEFFKIPKAGHAPNVEQFKIFYEKFEAFLLKD